MQSRHSLLTDGIHASIDLLGRSNRLFIQMSDQVIRGLPGLLCGWTNDHMKPDTEAQISSLSGSKLSHSVNLGLYLIRRLTPGQVYVYMLGSPPWQHQRSLQNKAEDKAPE